MHVVIDSLMGIFALMNYIDSSPKFHNEFTTQIKICTKYRVPKAKASLSGTWPEVADRRPGAPFTNMVEL